MLHSARILTLAIVGSLVTGLSAQAQSITRYEPSSAAAGETVTIRGEGIGSRAADHSVRFGRGGSPIGSLTILAWDTGRSRVSIQAQLPSTIGAGTYWLAVYQGSTQVARGPETFVVSGGGGGPTPGITIREAPMGAVAPIQGQVRLSPELAIVAVERTTSGAIEAGSRIPVRVRVRNSSPHSAQIAVGWVGDRPFPTSGYHSEPGAVPASGEAVFMLDLTPVPSHTRDGRFTTHVALLDPGSFSLYTSDSDRRNNSMEVSFDLGVPEFYDITVTWSRLMVHDDTDPNGSGEWSLFINACSKSPGMDIVGCVQRAETRWPSGVGSGLPTIDVTDNRPATIGAVVSLTRVPRDHQVWLLTGGEDDDGLEANERLQGHRVVFDPATWRAWGRASSVAIDRSTLAHWSDNNRSSLEYTGTLTILAQPSR